MKTLICPVGAYATNCYLLHLEESCRTYIIDPGAEPDKILDKLSKLPAAKNIVVYLTHAHADHVGALPQILDAIGQHVVYMRREEEVMYRSPCNEIPPYYPLLRNLPDASPVSSDEYCQVLDLPGHTPGGAGYLFNEGDKQVLFAGDTLFYESVGRTDLPGGDWDALKDSVSKNIYTLPDDVLVYPGHGQPTTVGHEKKYNPYVR